MDIISKYVQTENQYSTEIKNESKPLRKSMVLLSILFVISFFFPIIEDGDEYLFLNIEIFSEENLRNIPKLPFILPLIFAIIIFYVQRAFEIKKLIKTITIMSIVGLVIIISSLDDFGNLQGRFNSRGPSLFSGTLFLIAFILIYMGATNLSQTTKGKLASFLSSLGGVLFLIYLFKTQYFPLGDTYMNVSNYEIPIEFLNKNFFFTSALYFSIYILLFVVAYRSSNILYKKQNFDFPSLINSNKKYFNALLILISIGFICLIVDYMFYRNNIDRFFKDWEDEILFPLTIFLKTVLLFLPFLILTMISISIFFKHFIPDELPWLNNLIKNLLRKAE